jgi:hypothetical protein
MLSLGSTPYTRPARSDVRRHLGGEEARTGTDVEHVLAGLE